MLSNAFQCLNVAFSTEQKAKLIHLILEDRNFAYMSWYCCFFPTTVIEDGHFI